MKKVTIDFEKDSQKIDRPSLALGTQTLVVAVIFTGILLEAIFSSTVNMSLTKKWLF